MSIIYKPISHFFVDHTAISDAESSHYATDAFGPLNANQFRTTSFVRAKAGITSVKVFSICDGKIIVQPSLDINKVNIILKPSDVYGPLKIKYFIYRGINKSDLINGDLIKTKNLSDAKQPKYIRKIWDVFSAYIATIPGATLPTSLSATVLGYNPLNQSGNSLIDEIFDNPQNGTNNYEPPICKLGDHIGNFTGQIGLEVVLDYGNYRLINQEILFNLDLTYARKNEHLFDLNTVEDLPIGTIDNKKKRYKENILQFLDSAAFWGSHVIDGKVKLYNAIDPLKTRNISSYQDVFTEILSKLQNNRKVYTYLRADEGRSFNFYYPTRTLDGLEDGKINETNGWPILIQTRTFVSDVNSTESVNIVLKISSTNKERTVLLDLIVPNNDLSIFPRDQVFSAESSSIIQETNVINIQIPAFGKGLISTFMIIFCNIQEVGSLDKYYNSLWPANIKSNFFNQNQDEIFCSTYAKNVLLDLEDIIDTGCKIQNEIIFDNGKNTLNQLVPRILNIATVKSNVSRYNILNSSSIVEFRKKIESYENYKSAIYKDPNISVFKGTFKDNGISISSLNLVNNKTYDKPKSLFQLGITTEDYNKLIYDNPSIQPSKILPDNAENASFYLEPESFTNTDNVFFLKKFKLGLRYENLTDLTIKTIFPTTNPVYVYTIDNFYFFSKDYSNAQRFSSEFIKSNAYFRVIETPFTGYNGYRGEFGFDWMRDGVTPPTKGNLKYWENVGKLYDNSTPPKIIDDGDTFVGNFITKLSEFEKLELEYKNFIIQPKTILQKYYVPSLTIYPVYVPPTDGSPDLDRQSFFTTPSDDTINRLAKLKLTIDIVAQPSSIKLVYDSTLFSVITNPLPNGIGHHVLNISVTCIKEFIGDQYIEVVATYGSDNFTIGLLQVNPNKKELRSEKKILIVDVITQFNGTTTANPPNYSVQEHGRHLMMYLRQGLITPVLSTIAMDLINSPDTIFESKYKSTGPKGISVLHNNNQTPIVPISNATAYLYDKLKTASATDLYKDYYVLFLFHENGFVIDKNGNKQGLNGISNGHGQFADFLNTTLSNTSHEFLHTAGVGHTFANRTRHTFKPQVTDNIMDYSHALATPLPTISLFNWQIEEIKNKLDRENK